MTKPGRGNVVVYQNFSVAFSDYVKDSFGRDSHSRGLCRELNK